MENGVLWADNECEAKSDFNKEDSGMGSRGKFYCIITHGFL